MAHYNFRTDLMVSQAFTESFIRWLASFVNLPQLVVRCGVFFNILQPVDGPSVFHSTTLAAEQ